MIFSVIWGMAPWYVWVLGILILVAITALNLWVPAIAILRKIPPVVWGVGIVIVVAYFALEWHDARVRAEAIKPLQDEITAANKAYADNLVALHRKLEIADGNAQAAELKHTQELAAAEKKHQAAFATLEAKRNANVTAEAARLCTLTRGVVLQFNAGAARANGSDAPDDQAPAGSGSQAVDAPAGVPLNTYAAAVDATHDALGACRDQVVGWQTYHANVVQPWIASTLEALSTCIPKP
jgi:hypothetical protein